MQCPESFHPIVVDAVECLEVVGQSYLLPEDAANDLREELLRLRGDECAWAAASLVCLAQRVEDQGSPETASALIAVAAAAAGPLSVHNSEQERELFAEAQDDVARMLGDARGRIVVPSLEAPRGKPSWTMEAVAAVPRKV